MPSPRETDCGINGSAEPLGFSAKANIDVAALELINVELPGS